MFGSRNFFTSETISKPIYSPSLVLQGQFFVIDSIVKPYYLGALALIKMAPNSIQFYSVLTDSYNPFDHLPFVLDNGLC
jgi:hypothetical protein